VAPATATAEQLSVWGANFVDARSLAEVFRSGWAASAAMAKCGPFAPLFNGSFPECIVNNGTVE
jgi:hypothetical protein